MPESGHGLALVESHDAARGEHRHHGADAKLGRLLQREVHPLAARYSLYQCHCERRLAPHLGGLANPHPHPAAFDREDLAVKVPAAAIECNDRRTGAQSQHARDVVCCRGGQRDLRTGCERRLTVHAAQSQVAASIPARAVWTSASTWSGSITYGGMK